MGHRIIEINGDSVVAKNHQYIVDILANTIGSVSIEIVQFLPNLPPDFYLHWVSKGAILYLVKMKFYSKLP